jgi:hypothetical protein
MNMKLAAIAGTAVLLILGSPSIASDITGCYPITPDDAKTAGAPRFEDYATVAASPGKPAPVNLASHPRAKQFRTALRDGVSAGPDFAGYYTIVGWGCGGGCLDFAIVDAANGRVFFPPDISTVSVANVDQAKDEAEPKFDALRYRLDSNLLMVLGAPKEDEKRDGIAYYRWDGASLKPVSFLRSKKHDCSAN